MPRTYYCKKCGESHDPPTGRHCKQHQRLDETQPPALMTMLAAIQDTMSKMSEKMGASDNGKSPTPSSAVSVSERQDGDADENESPASASPQTLRRDKKLMKKAAARLALLQLDDSDDDDLDTSRDVRTRGKKSGSLMTAAETVQKSIDWPHLYVCRAVGARRRPVTYSDLRIEEFVYGFLCMIDSAKCKWDYRVMTQILKNLMLDTMDFTWNNALNFYQIAGIEVEQGTTKWEDAERIRELHMTYSRTVFPAKRESKETQPQKSTPQSAPAGMKACVAYQKSTCEHDKDHPPFTHACAYCHRTKSLLCRHSETACFRKSNDSKNGTVRES